MTGPSLPRKPRGRPRGDERLVPVTAKVTSAAYDRLVRIALKRDESVSSVVRTLLTLRLR